uniref:Aminotransferase n=1 Tax=Angiostrongylus cantonensis TaxID=6313 RepID=A0A0K0D3K9_ANGCA
MATVDRLLDVASWSSYRVGYSSVEHLSNEAYPLIDALEHQRGVDIQKTNSGPSTRIIGFDEDENVGTLTE